MSKSGAAAIIVGIIIVVVYLCEKINQAAAITASSKALEVSQPSQPTSATVTAPYEVTQLGSTTYVKMTSSGGVESISLPNNAPIGTTGPR